MQPGSIQNCHRRTLSRDSDRIACALRACLGPIDPTFYVAWSHLDAADQTTVMARAERTEKGAGLPARRIAVMGGGLIGMVRAGAYEEAFEFLNGLSMPEILTTALSARGAAVERPPGVTGDAVTVLADLIAHLPSVGVNAERLRLGLEAANFVGDYAGFERAQPAVSGPSINDDQRNDIKNFLSGSGQADFAAIIGNPDLFVGGQFFWSGELTGAINTDPAVVALRSSPAHPAVAAQFAALLRTANDRDKPTSVVSAQANGFIAAVRSTGAPSAARLIALASFVGPQGLASAVPSAESGRQLQLRTFQTCSWRPVSDSGGG